MGIKLKRKRLYVSKAIQGKLARKLVLYWCVYHFLMWHVLLFLNGSLLSDGRSFGDLYQNFFHRNMSVVVFIIAWIPIVIYQVIKISNLIVGPLIRFERALKQMGEGEQVSPVRLREKDMLTEFTQVFNEFVANHNERLRRTEESETQVAEACGV